MKKELYRGKRIRVLSGDYQGQHGTITHLDGDPGEEADPTPYEAIDGDEEVWVLFDSGEEGWIDAIEVQIVG